MRFVVDASVAVKWYVKQFEHPNAYTVLRRVLHKPELFAVPELFCYETLAVLYRHHPLALAVFRSDIDRILLSGILRYPMTKNLYERMDRFIRLGLTGYDAVYAALAEELDGFWITFDSKAHYLIKAENKSIDLHEADAEQLFP